MLFNYKFKFELNKLSKLGGKCFLGMIVRNPRGNSFFDTNFFTK